MSDIANDNLENKDYVLPFMLNLSAGHGKIISLSESISKILSAHAYSDNIAEMLAELTLIAAMLGSNLKNEQGIITTEIRTKKGEVKAVADYVYGGDIRGYCKKDLTKMPKEGFLVVTMDMGKGYQRYQGTVELKPSLLDTMREFFKSSQQIDADFKTYVKKHEDGTWFASGITIQKIAQEGGVANDTHPSKEMNWESCKFFIASATDEEMSMEKITAEELLRRLFHEDEVMVYPKTYLQNKCRCSAEKMQKAFDTIPESERESLAIDGKIVIGCEFCGQEKRFDP